LNRLLNDFLPFSQEEEIQGNILTWEIENRRRQSRDNTTQKTIKTYKKHQRYTTYNIHMGLTLYNARVIRGSMNREQGSKTKSENKHRNEVGNSREMRGVDRAGHGESMHPFGPCEFKMTGITIVNQLGN
jgi:hypothetical protein